MAQSGYGSWKRASRVRSVFRRVAAEQGVLDLESGDLVLSGAPGAQGQKCHGADVSVLEIKEQPDLPGDRHIAMIEAVFWKIKRPTRS